MEKRADDAFSILIRTEAGFKCQFHERIREMNIIAPCVCRGSLQCCHKISRRKVSIRFDRRNVLCGCSASNLWAKHNQEWNALWKLMYPQDVEYLEGIKNKIVHHKAWDYKFMTDEFNKQLLSAWLYYTCSL